MAQKVFYSCLITMDQQKQDILSKEQSKEEEDDSSLFEIVDRKERAKKYLRSYQQQPGVDRDQAIMVSIADMEFKFSPQMFRKLVQLNGSQPHFGYPAPKKSVFQALRNWVNSRYLSQGEQVEINQFTTIFWNNLLCVTNAVTEVVTAPGEQILLLCPTYYRYVSGTLFLKRQLVSVQMKAIKNRFYLDFHQIQKVLSENKIKLIIFASPLNPTGRIWSHQELSKLKDLLLKYGVFVLADQIFSDVIEPSEKQSENGLKVKDIFTSLLRFRDLHQNLVYACSYTKAFNCSGLGLGYTVCLNPKVQQRLQEYWHHMGTWATSMAYDLLEVCYSTSEAKNWKNRVNRYIQENFEKFKELCQKETPKLIIYQQDCSYLCLVDFRQYGVEGKGLVNFFTKINICPTFMDSCYVGGTVKSQVRINLALNRSYIPKLVHRIKKGLQEESSVSKE